MNLKALITALVLAGTSTAALADSNVRDHRDSAPAYTVSNIRDHRGEQPEWTRTFPQRIQTGIYGRVEYQRPRPVTLSSSMRIVDRFASISSDAGFNGLSKLELSNDCGSTYVKQVTVVFAGNQTQVVHLNQWLNGNQQIQIPLQTSGTVKQIVVYGNTSANGAFNVLGA